MVCSHNAAAKFAVLMFSVCAYWAIKSKYKYIFYKMFEERLLKELCCPTFA